MIYEVLIRMIEKINSRPNVFHVLKTDLKIKLFKRKAFDDYQRLFLYSSNTKVSYVVICHYIIPGIPPPIGGIPPAGSSSLMSTNAHSVVKIIPATDAAFSKAIRVTFLGSIIPALSMST